MPAALKPFGRAAKIIRFLAAPGSGDALRFVAQRPHILKMVSGRGEIALDLGCGSGFYGRELAKSHRWTVLSDVNMDNLLTQVTVNPVCARVRLCMPDLPFKSACADTIFLIEVLEHIEKDELLVSEMSRILKKRGTLVLSVPHPPEIGGVQEASETVAFGHVRGGYGYEDIKALVERHGFRVMDRRYCLFYPARASLRLMLFLKKLWGVRPLNLFLMPLWMLDLLLPSRAFLKPYDIIIKAVKK
ncbi:MAG: class I SAM-dependent methyltransferase [Desulfobacterales bacterium]|nr:MAG: class I SAM-dependent methyltransferase [Desulfobacterales bacterium]